MNVALLLVTHDDIGRVLLHTATETLGMCPLNVEVLAVRRNDEPQEVIAQAKQRLRALDQGGGVLVLTDIYGSTPSNIASALLTDSHMRAVAGLNLPMLIKVFNYPRLGIEELAQKAAEGGRDGIVAWDATWTE